MCTATPADGWLSLHCSEFLIVLMSVAWARISLIVYRLVHAPVIMLWTMSTRESWVRLPVREL